MPPKQKELRRAALRVLNTLYRQDDDDDWCVIPRTPWAYSRAETLELIEEALRPRRSRPKAAKKRME